MSEQSAIDKTVLPDQTDLTLIENARDAAERSVEDARCALRARRDILSRSAQQRTVESQGIVDGEVDVDALVQSEAARLEKLARGKLMCAQQHIEEARDLAAATRTKEVVGGEEAARAKAAEATAHAELLAMAVTVNNFTGHDVFYDRIIKLLRTLNQTWLAKYEDVLANYIEFFDKLTQALAKLSSAIKGSNDDGKFEVDFREVRDALSALESEYSNKYLVGGFGSKAEADAFLKDLGVQGLAVSAAGAGWCVRVDPARISELINVFPDTPSRQTMDPARYNAIIAAKDSRVERLSQVNNLLAEKYQRQNQQWDTLAKVLSNSIKEMDEAQKAFINAL